MPRIGPGPAETDTHASRAGSERHVRPLEPPLDPALASALKVDLHPEVARAVALRKGELGTRVRARTGVDAGAADRAVDAAARVLCGSAAVVPPSLFEELPDAAVFLAWHAASGPQREELVKSLPGSVDLDGRDGPSAEDPRFDPRRYEDRASCEIARTPAFAAVGPTRYAALLGGSMRFHAWLEVLAEQRLLVEAREELEGKAGGLGPRKIPLSHRVSIVWERFQRHPEYREGSFHELVKGFFKALGNVRVDLWRRWKRSQQGRMPSAASAGGASRDPAAEAALADAAGWARRSSVPPPLGGLAPELARARTGRSAGDRERAALVAEVLAQVPSEVERRRPRLDGALCARVLLLFSVEGLTWQGVADTVNLGLPPEKRLPVGTIRERWAAAVEAFQSLWKQREALS